MVGVPRSKGCRICVQRRVKCDQTRPFCGNCKKGNRPCPGYGQGMKFQDEGPKLRQRYEHRSPDAEGEEAVPPELWADHSSSSSSSMVSARCSPSPATQHWDILGLDVSKGHGHGVTLLRMMEDPGLIPFTGADDDDFMRGGTRAGTLLSSGTLNFDRTFENSKLNTTIFSPDLEQRQLLYTFTSALSSPGMANTLPPMMQYHGRWLAHLPDLTGTQPLLDTAIRAVTLAHLGRLHGSEDLLVQSRPYYGKSLRLLNSALLDETQGMASETLSATILLSFYEMFASDSNDSWIRHAGGAGTLMRIRGPARHRYGFGREIYLAYRHALVIEAFTQDTSCFLNEPEWRELARSIHEDVRNSQIIGTRLEIFDAANDFFMEMVQIPTLMYNARNLKLMLQQEQPSERASDVIKSIKEDIITRAVKHRANLKGIFVRFSSALRNVGHAPTSYMSGDPVIPIYYKYVNIFVASSHTGYWTLLILLNMLIREMDRAGLNDDLYVMENREAALDCCRSEPFMATSSFLGPFFTIFALRLSLAVLESKREREWIVQKLFHIGNTHMAMAKHMPDSMNINTLPKVRDSVDEIDRIEAQR